MLVVYSSNDEVIVCKKKDEPQVIKDYFDSSTLKLGRDIDNFDRTEEPENVVVIGFRTIVR